MPEQEKEYYRSSEVLITNTRAEMGGRTFAMANITAVSMATVPRVALGCIVFLVGIGGLITVVGLSEIDKGAGWLLVGVIVLGAGCIWWSMLKPLYAVNLGSASGESRAMQSHNKEEIEQIVAAIKQAIIERG